MQTDPSELDPLTSPVGDCEEIDPGAVWSARFLAAACSLTDGELLISQIPSSKFPMNSMVAGYSHSCCCFFSASFLICIFLPEPFGSVTQNVVLKLNTDQFCSPMTNHHKILEPNNNRKDCTTPWGDVPGNCVKAMIQQTNA